MRLSSRPSGTWPLLLRQSRKKREPLTASEYLAPGPPLSPRPGALRWGVFAGAGRTGVVSGGCVGGGGCGCCGCAGCVGICSGGGGGGGGDGCCGTG